MTMPYPASIRPWSVSDYGQWYDPDWSLAVTLGMTLTGPGVTALGDGVTPGITLAGPWL